MDYNKETDRYLSNSKVLYNSTQKNNFRHTQKSIFRIIMLQWDM